MELIGERLWSLTLCIKRSSPLLETLGGPDLFLSLNIPSYWCFTTSLYTAVLIASIDCNRTFRQPYIAKFYNFNPFFCHKKWLFTFCSSDLSWFWLKRFLVNKVQKRKSKNIGKKQFYNNPATTGPIIFWDTSFHSCMHRIHTSFVKCRNTFFIKWKCFLSNFLVATLYNIQYHQARNQLRTPGRAKSFLRGEQIF